MCGIVGYMGEGNETILREMVEAIKHRGPDSQGVEIIKNVGLGHARLAILDLSASGHQPMWNEDKTIGLVFNGEIYNFKEIRDKLKKKHIFQSQTDTEVLIHAYEEKGEAIFSELRGMFAIAFYDVKKDEIILARDHVGKKPLFWSVQKGTLIFASELKAIQKHPLFAPVINKSAISKYLQYEYIPTPETIFEHVYKLEPGHLLIWKNKKVTKKRFWKPSFIKNNITIPEAQLRLDSLLNESVKKRLMSDVPLGVFLSGGLDSSTVAYFAQKNSPTPIHTFSIGFDDPSFDESTYAKKVSHYLNTKHHHFVVTEKDVVELVPQLAHIIDEPMADASILPTFLLSKLARTKVTVALGGDGADELFAGYDTFLAHRFANLISWVPHGLIKMMIKIVSLMPVSHTYMSFDFKVKRFLSGLLESSLLRDQAWLGSFSAAEREKLFRKEDVFEPVERHTKEHVTFWDKLESQYFNLYLLDGILVKADRASMAHGLEVRSPFLDLDIIQFAHSLPISFKLNFLTRKYLLKKTIRGKIPDEIIDRPKKGFGVPLGAWFKNELKPLVEQVLSKENTEKIGLFNHEYIDTILNEHWDNRVDHRKKIWTLLVLYIWMQKNI